MIGLLMNLILMGIILTGLLKAYYDIPFLNENPRTSTTVGIMILLIIIWVFPKILGFLIKLAVFGAIVFFICQAMGWDLKFLQSAPKKALNEVSEKAKEITASLDNLKLMSEPNQTFAARPTRVPSGSNLEFEGETVQLYGIDAPDVTQPCKNRGGSDYNCGQISQQKLQGLTGDQEVKCTSMGKNHRGNIVATCTAGGQDVAAMMVRSGWAVADQAVTDKYVNDEKVAYGEKAGMWEGKFQAPWTWRLKNSVTDVVKTENESGEPSIENSPFQKLMNFFKK